MSRVLSPNTLPCHQRKAGASGRRAALISLPAARRPTLWCQLSPHHTALPPWPATAQLNVIITWVSNDGAVRQASPGEAEHPQALRSAHPQPRPAWPGPRVCLPPLGAQTVPPAIRGGLDWVVTRSLGAHPSLQEAWSEPLSEEWRGRHLQLGEKCHSTSMPPAGASHRPNPREAGQDCAYFEGRRGGGQGTGIRLREEKETVWEDGFLRMWGGKLATATQTRYLCRRPGHLQWGTYTPGGQGFRRPGDNLRIGCT